MAKKKQEPEAKDEDAPEGEAPAVDSKQGFVKKLLGNKKLLIIAAAGPHRAAAAWRAVRRDAPRHRSPNAGYPEAAMAGALGLALAGPRRYGGVLVDDALMGDGRRAATAADIRAALALYRRVDALLIGLVAVVAVVVVAM